MIHRVRGSLGLLGRVLIILLITVTIEFGVSTLLYERANRYSVQEDEARRLAEHLVIARKLMGERPWKERAALAAELTTDRYTIGWTPALASPSPRAPKLDEMRRQIVAWEPDLGRSDLRLRLPPPNRPSTVGGELTLPDGSWMRFSTGELTHGWELALGRIALALAPAIAMLILGALLIRRTLHPLASLARATDRVGRDSRLELPEEGTIEIRHLIRAFNTMNVRINRLIEERTEALAAVGHDLRTPLARLQFRAEDVPDPETRAAIGRDLGEMEEMLASLLAYIGGEDDPEAPVLTDLAVLAATIIDDRQDRGDDARYVGPDHADAVLRPMGMRRAIVNLVENALHYGAAVVLTLEEGADALTLRVEDCGPGIPEARMEEVLRPFARLDQARERNTQGLGLGLAIVASAVAREGGTLRLSNRAAGGLSAEISLPRGVALRSG